jgi:hypothetical protein
MKPGNQLGGLGNQPVKPKNTYNMKEYPSWHRPALPGEQAQA